MRQLNQNFFSKKRVLQEIKNFQPIKASTSENANETREREQYVVMQKQRYFSLRYKHISKQGSNIFVSFIIQLRVSGGFQYGGIQIK